MNFKIKEQWRVSSAKWMYFSLNDEHEKEKEIQMQSAWVINQITIQYPSHICPPKSEVMGLFFIESWFQSTIKFKSSVHFRLNVRLSAPFYMELNKMK